MGGEVVDAGTVPTRPAIAAAAHARVEQRLRDACAENGLAAIDWFASATSGGDGNREFFLRARGEA